MTRYLFLVLFAAALGMTATCAQSATGAAKKQAGPRAAQAAKPAKAKAPTKQPARNAPKSATGSKKKPSGKAATAQTGGSSVAREPEKPPQSTPSGTSAVVPTPTPGGDFAVPVSPSRPAKPNLHRMYALDGDTFYHNGRKVRVRGLEAVHDSDLAKQRLQRALDSGEVAVEPILTHDSGEVEAAVRVNGRDLTEMLRAEGTDAAQRAEQAAPPPATPEGTVRP